MGGLSTSVAVEVPPPLQKVLGKLDGVTNHGHLQYQANCPAHSDGKASLSIGWGDKGTVVFHCHANCEHNVIMKALNLKHSDLEAKMRLTAVYDYEDEGGELVYQVERHENGASKTFKQRRPGSHKNKSIYNMNGVEPLPFQLGELAEALDSGEDVYIVEGEKDALALWGGVGAVATCNHGGAGKWTDAHSEYFEGSESRVFIVADRDVPGYKHALKVYYSLQKVAGITAQVVLSAVGKDAADHISDHGLEEFIPVSREELIVRTRETDEAAEHLRLERVVQAAEQLRISNEARLLVAAEGWTPPESLGTLADQLLLDPEPPRWHWEGLVQVNWNVLVIAQAKAGKTTLALNFLRSLADGTPLFDKYTPEPLDTGRTIAWWNAELSQNQAMEWVRDLGIQNTDAVVPLHMRGRRMPFTAPAVRDWTVQWLRQHKVSFWIIDPMSALYTGDENSNSEVGAWLNAIDEIKVAAGVETVMLVHHTGRTDDDENLHARGASRLEGWADLPLIYVGQRSERRYLRTPSVGRDVEINVGLDFAQGSRSLIAVAGASRTADRKQDWALLASDAVWSAPEDKPLNATELKGALPGAKQAPQRAAITFAVGQGWIAAEAGPRNSTLYRRGVENPRKRKLSNTSAEE